MNEKFTLDQLRDSQTYKMYGYILATELDPDKAYSLSEVNKKLAKYIEKKG